MSAHGARFTTITGDDWKRSLDAARARRATMPARMTAIWHDFGDGHRYDEIYDDRGRRYICVDCGANAASDRMICKRVARP